MKTGNLADLQEHNLSRILELLRENEGISRQDLVEMTGLSASGVSKLVGELIDKGLVVEDTVISRNKGRRAISLKLNPNSVHAVGVRLARHSVQCGLFNVYGRTLFTTARDFRTRSLAEAKSTLQELIEETLQESRERNLNVIGIGVSAPGPLFSHEGRIVLTSNYAEWKDFSVKEFLESRFNIPVYVEHDANVSVLAEKWFGKGVGSNNLVYVVVDRGVGAGIFCNGQLYRGHHGIAGEIGHTTICYDGPACECGNRGCLEMYCSSLSVLMQARDVLGADVAAHEQLTIDTIARLAREGDLRAQRLLTQAGRFLGIGVANLINAYNPERIILGGEAIKAGEPWFEAVKESVRDRTLPEVYAGTEIYMSELEIDPAFLGTGSLVIAAAFENVSELKTYSATTH